MTRRDTAPVGAPCWVDLGAADFGRSRDFYCRVLGWEATEPVAELGGYVTFTSGGVPVAGGAPAQPGMPDAWTLYVATDDAGRAVEAATAAGGTVLLAPMPVADLGTMAVLGDPSGAAIGLWQPGTHQGFGVVGEAGAPSWFELATRDHDGAVAFYRAVFGWDTSVGDTAEVRYTVMLRGGEMVAGVMDASALLPDGAPPYWAVYFGVGDTDAALAEVTALGGSVVSPARDTPHGRMATAADPSGVAFKVVAMGAAQA